MWLTVSQYILGIQPDYDGLAVRPCLPSTAKEYTVTRRFRDAEYVITVKNPDGKQTGLSSLTIDGQTVAGDVLPYSPGKHEVVAIL